jgi:hypothetical protein
VKATVTDSARPRVAALVTVYYPDSHADVIVGKLLDGYLHRGVPTAPRIEVASLYLDQIALDDTGRAAAARHGVPVHETVGEALTLGGRGVAVDGVLIIGEHGDYPVNDRGQILYPRRRLFDAAVAAMVAGGRTVPVFVDKHLAWRFADARRMYDAAARLGIPLLAGSSVPLAWRVPALEWPLGGPMTEAVVVGYGPLEAYEFHALEGLQCLAERRTGGETGVAAVEEIPPALLARARVTRRWSEDLEVAALAALGLDGHGLRRARANLSHAIVVEYRDGLRAAVLWFAEGVDDMAFAGRHGDQTLACRFALEPRRPYGHFALLVRQIEALVLSGQPPYPVARTLLTTGTLDVAMHSRFFGGARIETPELAIAYDPPAAVPDSGRRSGGGAR